MIFENRTTVICPVTDKEVVIADLYDAEPGGSCQADISMISRTCNFASDCREARCNLNCLLFSDNF